VKISKVELYVSLKPVLQINLLLVWRS